MGETRTDLIIDSILFIYWSRGTDSQHCCLIPVLLSMLPLRRLPGCHPQSHAAASFLSGAGGNGPEKQGSAASAGRRPGLSTGPQWGQKLRHPE